MYTYIYITNLSIDYFTMLSGNENTICNLRLVGGIRIHQYIQTDSDGNILSFLEHNFINCVSSAIYGENWKSTLFCLRKLYVDELPKLLTELIKNKSNKELTKIGALLEQSLAGLENLKTVYQGTDNLAHINTLSEDFCKNQLDRVVEYLGLKSLSKEMELKCTIADN